MSLPETIQWCEEHNEHEAAPGIGYCWLAAVPYTSSPPCRFVTLPVADPDDQLAIKQIEKLAQFIMDEVPGEPSQSEGAVDTAIRLLRGLPGPDDLLVIRGEALLRVAYYLSNLESSVEALLAAAEGGEDA